MKEKKLTSKKKKTEINVGNENVNQEGGFLLFQLLFCYKAKTLESMAILYL